MQQSKGQQLATQSIGSLLFKLAVPAVAAQLVNMLYNMVDRMYIGRIPNEGTLALTGMGVCMPVILLISASSALISMGGAPRASIKMGENRTAEAEQILGNCAGALLAIAALLTVVFLLFAEPLLLLFGASSCLGRAKIPPPFLIEKSPTSNCVLCRERLLTRVQCMTG